MTSVHRNAVVPRSARHMYDIVNDVEGYPHRFDWCTQARVLERSETEVIARLTLRFAGMNTSITTRNGLEDAVRITLDLVEGPFTSLRGAWGFRPLGERGCKVSLDLDFEMSGKLVGTALAVGFASFADHMVEEFVRAALAS